MGDKRVAAFCSGTFTNNRSLKKLNLAVCFFILDCFYPAHDLLSCAGQSIRRKWSALSACSCVTNRHRAVEYLDARRAIGGHFENLHGIETCHIPLTRVTRVSRVARVEAKTKN